MNDPKISVAAILTCHNRKEKTLISLRNLASQDGLENLDLNVFLVDDGSTDGTSTAVMSSFPEVNIFKGDGTLFWNGGMRFAFGEAMIKDYDYYLWLNDDTFLEPKALEILLDTSHRIKQTNGNDVIVTGTIKDVQTGAVNYGGRIIKSIWQPVKFLLVDSKQEPQQCDTFNGNVVLIPHIVAEKIGNISPEYSKQHGGDFDYGLRAKYAGFKSWVAPGIIATCPSNAIEGSLFDKSLPFKERIKQMKSPRGVPPAKEWLIFTRRHAGFLWPLFWLRTMVRMIFPGVYLIFKKPQ